MKPLCGFSGEYGSAVHEPLPCKACDPEKERRMEYAKQRRRQEKEAAVRRLQTCEYDALRKQQPKHIQDDMVGLGPDGLGSLFFVGETEEREAILQ